MIVKLMQKRANFKKICFHNQYCVTTKYSIHTNLKVKTQFIQTDNITNSVVDPIWNTALPFDEIPGPSKWSFLMSFLPGGTNYKRTLMELHRNLREKYGNVLRIPGQFGRRDVILTFDPNDFEKVFRTEGVWPVREGLDSIHYYRKNVRTDFYKEFGGLVAEQGKDWATMRKITNPVMMNPKTVKAYIPAIDAVSMDFLERIQQIRHPQTKEMPVDFELEINRWALESIGVIALDTRLGLINEFDKRSNSIKVINAIKDFFKLIYELDFKPSLWKYIETPKFRKLLATFDVLHEIISEYIKEGLIRMENNSGIEKCPHQQSVLEKLLRVNPQVAHIMAMDMLLAGVDTTSAAFVSCCFEIAKNPDKQNNLRNELRKILPRKDSPLTMENMKNMPYLRACIKESFRLTPVLVGNFRSAGQDIVLSGYQIPKGTNLCLSSVLLQRDDKHFPNADKFIPERWLRNMDEFSECPSAKFAHPFIYLPFGFGPRTCIGKRFAELQIEVLISRIVRNFYIEWNYPDIVFQPNFLNVPTGNLQFKYTDVTE